MKRIAIAIIVACAISFTAGFSINEGLADYVVVQDTKVIGKAIIKAGVRLDGVVMVMPGQMTEFRFKSFKEQTAYILDKVAAEGTTPGGYILEGDGLAHDCPIHGEEPMGTSMLVVTQPRVDSGEVTIQLFE